MPSSLKIDLILDKPSSVYSPGETLSGVAVIELERSRKILSICLKLSGVGSIKTQSGKVLTEKYLEEEITLDLDSEKNSYKQGKYTFPIAYTLSSDLPSTFIDVYSTETMSIEYLARLQVISKPVGLPFKQTTDLEKPFYVESLIDLNKLNPAIYNTPCAFEGYFTNNSKHMIQKMIEISVRIPKKAYVPGELITVDAVINNKSSRDFFCLEVKLVQTVGPNTNVLSLLEMGTIAAHSTGHLNSLSIEVPNMKVISCNNSKLFKIGYYLVFSGRVWAEYYYHIPLIIGSKPFRRMTLTPLEISDLKALRVKSSLSESASNTSLSSRQGIDEPSPDKKSSNSSVFIPNEEVSA